MILTRVNIYDQRAKEDRKLFVVKSDTKQTYLQTEVRVH